MPTRWACFWVGELEEWGHSLRTHGPSEWKKKKKQTYIGNSKNTKERCHQTQTEEKRESFLEAAARARNFKKQLGGRTEGVMEGCPHRGKSTQYLLSTASPYLGLDWAWRTKEREVARYRCGYRVNHWGPWVPFVKSLFKTEASFGRVSDTANLWFRKITLVMVWSIYKRNKNWKQEDQLRSIFKRWKWKVNENGRQIWGIRAVSNRTWWCEDKADESRKNLSFPAWVTDRTVILTPSRLRILKKVSDMMF